MRKTPEELGQMLASMTFEEQQAHRKDFVKAMREQYRKNAVALEKECKENGIPIPLGWQRWIKERE